MSTASVRQCYLELVPATHRPWQTFDDARLADGTPRRDRRLARVLFGDYRAVASPLQRLNDPSVRAGVYVTGQLTDGKGRCDRNITRIVVIVADIDHGQRKPWPIPPTITVQTSPGKFQAWWVLTDGDELTRAEHSGIMARLVADYGADRNAVDVPRVYRPPGFWHHKGEPFLVRIVGGSFKTLRGRELLLAFPAPPPKISERALAGIRRPAFTEALPRGLERFDRPLRAIPSDDYATWIAVGLALHGETGGSNAGLALWDAWSAKSSKHDAGVCAGRWDTFKRTDGARATGGKIFWLAEQHGWRRAPARAA